MLKILQARLQQYVNRELPDVQAGFRKGRGTCWTNSFHIPGPKGDVNFRITLSTSSSTFMQRGTEQKPTHQAHIEKKAFILLAALGLRIYSFTH